MRANWKLIFANYSECYHCPLVHPELSKLTPYDAAENDLFEGPFLGGFMPITRGSLTMSGNACALAVGDIKAEDHHRVFYYSIFPNMLLSLQLRRVSLFALLSPVKTTKDRRPRATLLVLGGEIAVRGCSLQPVSLLNRREQRQRRRTRGRLDRGAQGSRRGSEPGVRGDQQTGSMHGPRRRSSMARELLHIADYLDRACGTASGPVE